MRQSLKNQIDNAIENQHDLAVVFSEGIIKFLKIEQKDNTGIKGYIISIGTKKPYFQNHEDSEEMYQVVEDLIRMELFD